MIPRPLSPLPQATSALAILAAGTPAFAQSTKSVTIDYTPPPPAKADLGDNAVFDAWYNYDRAPHALTSKNAVYAIRLADGGLARLQFTDYVDGKYGCSSLVGKRIAPPARGPGESLTRRS
ncbi:hypothetical protein D3C72_131360 [compost metagenome]